MIEIYYLPGTTLMGLAGTAALITGNYLMYSYYGFSWGNITLGLSLLLLILLLLVGYRFAGKGTKTMKAVIDYRLENKLISSVNIGDKGETITDLRPQGKVRFAGRIVDVHSEGEFLPTGINVEITAIEDNRVVVRAI